MDKIKEIMQAKEIRDVNGFRKWLPLIILSLALAIIILDTTILNVSLRTIINDLHTDIQSIQWVITAYSLMLAAFTITGGRLGDLFGRKKMFVVGAIIFAIGSFMTSMSKSVGFMIAGEAIVEGIGAALMMPATSSLLVANYKGRDRQIGFGIWGGIAAGAAALGPVVGGGLTTYFSWRWAFRINVGVVILLVLGSIFIPETRDTEHKPTIDFVGILLSALGMLSIVFGFIKASDYGWWTMKKDMMLWGMTVHEGAMSFVPLVIYFGLIVLGLFALWERRMERMGKTPLVSLHLFQNTQFTYGVIITALMSLGQAGLSFSLPVFLQAVKQLNAFATGIAMLPMTLTLLVAAPLSAALSKNITAKRIIQAGLILNAMGYLLLRTEIQVAASPWSIAPGMVLIGLGVGCMMSQISNITLSAVSVQQAGEASGVNGTFRQVGATLGSAIIGAVLISSLTTNLIQGVNNSTIIPSQVKPALSKAVSEETSSIEFGSGSSTKNTQMPKPVFDEIKHISEQATVNANHMTIYFVTAFMLLALFMSIKLPNKKNLESDNNL